MLDKFEVNSPPLCEAHVGFGIYCDRCGYALWQHTHMREERDEGRTFHRSLRPFEKSAAKRTNDERAEK